MGIEPTLSAWEADALPLSYTRIAQRISRCHTFVQYSITILIQMPIFVNMLRRLRFFSTKGPVSFMPLNTWVRAALRDTRDSGREWAAWVLLPAKKNFIYLCKVSW